jgi:hypothetical protein
MIDIVKWMEKENERSAELHHEQRLAAIRTESHALVWTGEDEELTATVTKWYESGWLPATSLQDALLKATIHFSKPNGMPVIRLESPAELAEDFSPSPNYQKLTFRGKEYDLTPYSHAPRILKVLHESFHHGEVGMTTSQIRKKAKLPNNGKMYDWFRGTGLWKHLVILVGKDLYRLDLPTKS